MKTYGIVKGLDVFEPTVEPNGYPVVKWIRSASTAELNEISMNEIIESLSAAISAIES